jgi:uncharacterized Zn-binding protein involved in type VI secretion
MAALPAARVNDAHTCPLLVPLPHVSGPIQSPCATTVLIDGLPAARATDQALCTGPRLKDVLLPGATTVLIQGKPAVRLGDPTSHGGKVTGGDSRVLIG